jgi:hypothetical protein
MTVKCFEVCKMLQHNQNQNFSNLHTVQALIILYSSFASHDPHLSTGGPTLIALLFTRSMYPSLSSFRIFPV